MTLRPTTRLGLSVAAMLAAGLAAVLLMLRMPIIAVPALVGMALGFVIEPLFERWEAKGHSRGGALAIFGAILGSLVLVAALAAPPLVRRQLDILQEQGPAAIERLKSKVAEVDTLIGRELPFLGEHALQHAVEAGGDHFREHILPHVPVAVAEGTIALVLIPLVTFFMLKDGRKAMKAILEAVPNRHFEMALNIFHRMGEQVGSYLRGVIVEALLVGATCWVLLLLLGVPGAGMIASVVCVTNVIPYFGPVAGAVTGIIYCVMIGEPNVTILKVIGAVVAARAADDVVIAPAVIGHAINIHALAVILLLFVGGNLFGLLGLVIAIPLWAVIRVVIQETARAVRAYSRYVVD